MFEKPGPKQKKAKIKNKARSHDIKKEKDSCQRCEIENDKLRVCHYEGSLKSKYGKGVGVKVDDNLVSVLCDRCDKVMADKPDRNDELAVLKFEVEWCHLILKYHFC